MELIFVYYVVVVVVIVVFCFRTSHNVANKIFSILHSSPLIYQECVCMCRCMFHLFSFSKHYRAFLTYQKNLSEREKLKLSITHLLKFENPLIYDICNIVNVTILRCAFIL